MRFIWFRVLVNPELISVLSVMCEASVLGRQLFALHECNAVGWNHPSISSTGKVFCYLQSIQTTSEAS
jgi:hypothetical protein